MGNESYYDIVFGIQYTCTCAYMHDDADGCLVCPYSLWIVNEQTIKTSVFTIYDSNDRNIALKWVCIKQRVQK